MGRVPRSDAPEKEPARGYLTPAEVGRIVGVAPTTVTRWAREGKLPCLVTLGGHRRFDPDVVEVLKRTLGRGKELASLDDVSEEDDQMKRKSSKD